MCIRDSASTELMINKNVSEDSAYKMVKAMCEKRDDIVIASLFPCSILPRRDAAAEQMCIRDRDGPESWLTGSDSRGARPQ